MARPNMFTRRYFVQKGFQGKFILLYALSVCTVVGLATWSLYRQIEAAVETHLYRTHITIERVGDFLVALMFSANLYAILAVFAVVLFVSLLVFRAINGTFQKIDYSIETMAKGDFSQPYQQGYAFAEVGDLRFLLEQARVKNNSRFEQLSSALDDLEAGVREGDSERVKTGKIKLDLALEDVRL